MFRKNIKTKENNVYKLKAGWSVNSAQDLKAYYGLPNKDIGIILSETHEDNLIKIRWFRESMNTWVDPKFIKHIDKKKKEFHIGDVIKHSSLEERIAKQISEELDAEILATLKKQQATLKNKTEDVKNEQ